MYHLRYAAVARRTCCHSTPGMAASGTAQDAPSILRRGAQAVSHAEREELYQDYLRDAERRAREEKKRLRKQRAAAFRDLLLSITSIKVCPPPVLSYLRIASDAHDQLFSMLACGKD